MNQTQRALAWGSAFLIGALAGCGGRESVASKSAAAYAKAQSDGTPVAGGHEHGGHAAEPGTAGAGAAHAAMAGMDHLTGTNRESTSGGSMPGMDHAKMEGTGMAGPNRSDKPSGSMAGMPRSNVPAGSMAGMDHSTMPGVPHGGMTGMQHGPPPTPASASAPRFSAEMPQGPPATTLSPDAFDAPAASSVSEAEKAAGGPGHSAHDKSGTTGSRDAGSPPSGGSADDASATSHGRHGRAEVTARRSTSSPDTDPAAVAYTCPMHPEVTSNKPGKCPKCGMTLVKKN